MEKIKRAILVISFGTSYKETQEKTIGGIEKCIAGAFPEYKFYRAWTSPRIRAKLQKRDGIHVPDIGEAMEQMLADGIREAVVQPTYILQGFESGKMEEKVAACAGRFEKLVFGKPLLVSGEDKKAVAQALDGAYRRQEGDCLLFMGHGTEHEANVLYKELEDLFRSMGMNDVYMGTVEGDFSLANFLTRIAGQHYRRICLAPFMIVAGDHAINDMAGEKEDSWKSVIEKNGYETECILKGLGEFEAVREIFTEHVREAVRSFEEDKKES